MHTTQFTTGILIRRNVRNFLDEAIFSGYDFTYLETKGFIESTFTLKGNPQDINKVAYMLNSYYGDE